MSCKFPTNLFLGHNLIVSESFGSLDLPLNILEVVALSNESSSTKIVALENFAEDHLFGTK